MYNLYARICMYNLALEILNQRRIKSAPADSYSLWSMTDKYFNAAPQGRNEIYIQRFKLLLCFFLLIQLFANKRKRPICTI